MEMYQILSTIDSALKKKGLSRSFVSERATGSSSTLKNMWASLEAKRERRLGIDNIKKIADYLGLEFYFGPPRERPSQQQVMLQFQETASEFKTDRWVLPLVESDHPPGLPRLALPLNWLDRHGMKSEDISLVEQADTSMEPGIPKGATVLIDQSKADVADAPGKVYAIMLSGTPHLRRCDLTALELVALADNPAYSINSVPLGHLHTAPILGRVRAVISELD